MGFRNGQTSPLLTRLRGIIGRKSPVEAAVPVDGMLPASEFDEHLTKERSRADRGGSPFVLLTVDVCADRESGAYAKAVGVLVALLSERTRVIDVKGWFGPRIGLLLPHTTAEQAQVVWSHLEETYKRKMRNAGDAQELIQLKSEIYTYPSDGKHHALSEATNSLRGHAAE